MPELNQPREITPIQKFWGPSYKDMSPHPQKVEEVYVPPPAAYVDPETIEAEEVMTPAPKGLVVPESAPLPELINQTELYESELPVPPVQTIPAVDSESGKASDVSEPERVNPNPQSLSPEPLSPSSSSTQTSTGNATPPVVAKPPTSA